MEYEGSLDGRLMWIACKADRDFKVNIEGEDGFDYIVEYEQTSDEYMVYKKGENSKAFGCLDTKKKNYCVVNKWLCILNIFFDYINNNYMSCSSNQTSKTREKLYDFMQKNKDLSEDCERLKDKFSKLSRKNTKGWKHHLRFQRKPN